MVVQTTFLEDRTFAQTPKLTKSFSSFNALLTVCAKNCCFCMEKKSMKKKKEFHNK